MKNILSLGFEAALLTLALSSISLNSAQPLGTALDHRKTLYNDIVNADIKDPKDKGDIKSIISENVYNAELRDAQDVFSDVQRSGAKDKLEIKNISPPRAVMAPLIKRRQRRSFGYRSTCYPKIIKVCQRLSFNGTSKTFCGHTKKLMCYALD